MRLLFVKDSLSWPRRSGHDVHGFHMMRALAGLGHETALVTVQEPAPEAVAGLSLAFMRTLNGEGSPAVAPALSYAQERFRSYWGAATGSIRAVGRMASDWSADAVVAVGLEVLPYLGAVDGRLRVWYAADEWAWHHLSQVRLLKSSSWGELKQAAIKGLYERAYASMLDRVWVVSRPDRRAMRWVAGARAVDVVPNGVDPDHFAPSVRPQIKRSCVFWGRLDFGPNIQALEWFVGRIWPALRRACPDARFTIYGVSPTPGIVSMAGRDGIELVLDLPDLRPEIGRHQVVVLPFVSGGGIKNKLLEAASLGKAIVGTPRACVGLRGGGEPPLVVARGASRWVEQVVALWADRDWRERLGTEARRWVLEHHSWEAAASEAVSGLEASRSARPGRGLAASAP